MGKEIGKLSKNDAVKLKHLYSAIKDGFVKPGDAFGAAQEQAELPSDSEAESLNALNQQLAMGGTNGSDKG